MFLKIKNFKSDFFFLISRLLLSTADGDLLDKRQNGVMIRLKRMVLSFCFRKLNSEKRKQFNNCVWSSRVASGFFKSRIFPEVVIATMADLIQSYGDYDVCEIGCGNGQLLNILSARICDPSKKFLGIDLNSEQIDIDKKKNAGRQEMSFECVDVFEYLLNVKKHVFLFSFGTFTVFVPEMMQRLFSMVKSSPYKITLALYEPIDNLVTSNGNSILRDGYAFFHDYVGLAKENNLTIIKNELHSSSTFLFLVCQN